MFSSWFKMGGKKIIDMTRATVTDIPSGWCSSDTWELMCGRMDDAIQQSPYVPLISGRNR